MKYHQLNTTKDKRPKRVGRGIAAGQGKTAGRGTKGQGSRTGFSKNPGFAGGSNPLMQKLPKLPGFRSYRTPMETVYTGQLQGLSGQTVDAQALADAGLISNAYVSVKLLFKGDLSKKFTVKLPKASEAAIAAIQSAGGDFEKTTRLSRPQTSEKKQRKSKNA